MRLLLVMPKLVSYRSFLRELCTSLIADGVDVHIACSPEKLWAGDGSMTDDGVQVHAVDFPRGMNPAAHRRAARALDRLVQEIQPDLVHAHVSAAVFTTALARNARWPVTLATFHGVSFLALHGWKAALLRLAETWSARRFDAVWVLTDDDRDRLRVAAPTAVVHRLPGFGVGCDLDRFAPVNASEREELRHNLAIEPQHIVFVFVGRFTHFKGFGSTVRAFLRIAGGNPDVRLLLIGSRDPLHPTGLNDAEEEMLKASPHVIDTGYRSDVERCLGAADVMVFPSQREGMAVCLMEALAMGVPAITSDARGCRDVVRDGLDGLVLRDFRVDALASAMQRVADDRNLRQKWSARALLDRDRFSRSHFITAQKRIYEACGATRSHDVLALA